MKSHKYALLGNVFLIIYGVSIFIRITMMDASERDGFDIFQWMLGPVLVIVLGYRVIKQFKNKEES